MGRKKKKYFHLVEYYEGCTVNECGDVTIGFAWEKAAYDSNSCEELVNIKSGLVKALAVLPAGYVAIFQDRYHRMVYVGAPDGAEIHELQQCYNRHFDGRRYLQHQAFLFITKPGRELEFSWKVSKVLAKKHFAPETARDLAILREFQVIVERFVLILQQETGNVCRLLTKAELMGTRRTMGLTDPSALIALPGSLPVELDVDNREGVKIGDQYVATLSVSKPVSLPTQTSPVHRHDSYSTDRTDFPMEMAAHMGHQLDFDHISTVVIRIEEPRQELKKLDKSLRRSKSLGARESANQAAQADRQAYRDQLASGERLAVRMHANVMIWADNKTELARRQQQAIGGMARIGVTPHQETWNALQLYSAMIPGNGAGLNISQMTLTFAEQACSYVVTESAAHSSESPSSMSFVDRTTGIPVQVDLYAEPKRKGMISNYNKTVVGPSGSGKSVLMLYLLAIAFRQGHHLMVVDIGGSYKALCLYLGGRYFVVGDGVVLQLNPFLKGEDEELDTEKMESLITLLIILWKRGDQIATRSEYVALTDILRGFYQYLQQQPEIFPCFDALYEWLRDRCIPGLQAAGVREKDFDWTNFLFVLRPYYRGGEYEHLLNARENMNLLDQRFVVFELDAIKDHPILFPVVTIILMQLYMSKLRRLRQVRKILVMDEAWKALKKPVTAEFVQYAYKTVRKYNGEIVVATQDSEDLYGGEIVKNTIINNADTKIITDGRKLLGRFDEFQAAMGLTEKDKTLLFSLNPGDGRF